MSRFVASLFVLLTLTSPVFAQAPAPAAAPPPPPPRLEGTGDVALIATSGNSDTQNFGLAGEIISRPDPWTFRAKANYVRNKSAGLETAESFLTLFRASRALTPRTAVYGQYDYLRDVFAGIEHRNSLEGGVSYLAVDTSVHKLRLDAGLGYSNEQRALGDDVSTATATLGAGYKLRLSENADLADEGRFVFGFADAANWRFDNVASVTARLTTIFSLKASYTIRYNNDPAPTFEKTDTIAAVALVAKFARK